ncbi:MAG: transcription-repair coupling factor, partial [Pseudomonadales bacterium]|nr:transcription-repair coupling factor [Pseudomonadales bacterium]
MNTSLLSPPRARPGDHLRWGGLIPGADALALASVAREHPGTVVILTAGSATAERIESDLRFFLAGTGAAARPVLRLPDWETLPYDRFSPHQDLVSDRLLALSRLAQGDPVVLIVPVATLMQRTAPVAYVSASSLALDPGQRLGIVALRNTLARAGYRAVDNVYEHGEFAVRGSIVDLFPMGHDTPVRIELFDEEIETLRSFDPETQRSLAPLERLRLLPGREYPFDEQAIAAFRRRWHERFDNDHRACPDYQDIARGSAPGGIEYFLPLFFEQCATLFDYLPGQSLLCIEDAARAGIDHVWEGVNSRYRSLGSDITRPLLKPAEVFLPPEELRAGLKRHTRIEFAATAQPERAGAHNFNAGELPLAREAGKREDPVARIAAIAGLPQARRKLFCAETPGRREMLVELLARAGVKAPAVAGWEEFLRGDAPCAITIAPLAESFRLEEPSCLVVAESALFGKRVMQRRRRSRAADSPESAIRNLAELDIGSPVVHLEHRVGRYLGLQTLEVDGERAEFLFIEYSEAAKLFV